MAERYEAAHSAGEEPKTLIFAEGAFEALPFEVRLMEPWYGCFYIESESLKLVQRIEIARQGYTILRERVDELLNAA